MIETFYDLDELVTAIATVRGISALPIVALLTFDEDAQTLGGVSAEQAATTLQRTGRRRDRREPRRRPSGRAPSHRTHG